MKKNIPFLWTEEHKQALDDLRTAIDGITPMKYPPSGTPVAFTTDASNTGAGTVLEFFDSQQASWMPISFYSKNFSDAEKRYSTFDRELLAINLALRHFRFFLQDKSFVVYTDHKPLLNVLNSINPDWSDRVFRTVSYLSQFNLELQHVSGKSNVVADVLSWMISVVIELSFLDPVELQRTQSSCEDCMLATTSCSSLRLELRLIDGCLILGDISTPRFRPYVPMSLRNSIMESFHNLSHPGQRPTIKAISTHYVWHSMRKDKATFVKE